MPDLRDEIKTALQDFNSKPLRKSALNLLDILGYRSDRTLVLEGSKPQAFLDLVQSQPATTKFDSTKAIFSDWKSADILFQLTDDDLASTSSLFKETDIKSGLLRSYLFFAIEMKGSYYARSNLSAIARQINRVFPMPVMVLLKHGAALSIAVINRRQNKVHTDKDVLEKVTLIRDISLASPHRGHLDILQSFALSELEHPKKLPIRDFDALHGAWAQIFNIQLLNERFYKKIQEWFFWASQEVRFPHGGIDDDDQRNRIAMIRLLTRIIFCWFAKEKRLLPDRLFSSNHARDLLKSFDPYSKEDSSYYRAFIQNLFFAVLSIPADQRKLRDTRTSPKGVNHHYMNHSRLRHRDYFTDSKAPEDLFSGIPFLNGGLFECLDYREEYELALNEKKTKVLLLPRPQVENWVRELNDFQFPPGPIRFSTVRSFLDLSLHLAQGGGTSATLNYAIQMVPSRLNDRAKRLFVAEAVNLALSYPYLAPLFGKHVFTKHQYDGIETAITTFATELLQIGIRRIYPDAIAHALYYAIQHDLSLPVTDRLLKRAVTIDDCVCDVLLLEYAKRWKLKSLSDAVKKRANNLKGLEPRDQDAYWLLIYQVWSAPELRKNEQHLLADLKSSKFSFVRF